MTRADFEARTLLAATRALKVPPSWWGTWLDVTDGTIRVRFTRSDCPRPSPGKWLADTGRGGHFFLPPLRKP